VAGAYSEFVFLPSLADFDRQAFSAALAEFRPGTRFGGVTGQYRNGKLLAGVTKS